MPYGPPDEDVQTPSLPGINQGGELDPKIAQLLQIMKLLGNPAAPTPPPQPEPLKKWQKILFGGTGRDFLGSIGDSLAAQSSVLAGGAPPAIGAHAMQVRQRQMDQAKLMEDYNTQVERQNSSQEDFKRQIALQYMQGQNQMDVANVRQQKEPKSPILNERDRRVGNQNRIIRQILDPNSLETLSQGDLGLSANQPTEKTASETKPSIVYDKTGKAFWAYPPDAEKPGGSLIEVGFSKAANQAEAGMSEALNNAEYLLDKMQSHYDKAVKVHGPAERAFLSMPVSSKNPMISGPAGNMDPDAAIHERNRHMVAVALAAPLTGSRRGQAQIIQHISDGLPKYGDNPRIATEFYKQMHAVIANLRQAYPSGIPKNDAGDAVYLSELEDTINLARENAVAASEGRKTTTLPLPANPTGDRQVGTKGGVPVYERPDGSRYMKTGD